TVKVVYESPVCDEDIGRWRGCAIYGDLLLAPDNLLLDVRDPFRGARCTHAVGTAKLNEHDTWMCCLLAKGIAEVTPYLRRLLGPAGGFRRRRDRLRLY